MNPEQQEIERLRCKLARMKAERDILKKAAADSTGRCNALFVDLRAALVKRLSWRFPVQRLACLPLSVAATAASASALCVLRSLLESNTGAGAHRQHPACRSRRSILRCRGSIDTAA